MPGISGAASLAPAEADNIDYQKEIEAANKRERDFERLSILGSKLQTLAGETVAKRKLVEDRWIEDLRQLHGKYPENVLQAIRSAGGSEVFVNITRPKAETFAARMADMLLPTDDVNWGIAPTPIPEVVSALKSPVALVTPEGKPVVTEQQQPVTAGDMAKGIEEAAKEACTKMQQEMADQLMECGYNAVQRDIIEDMAVFGTGVLKGPAIVGKTRRAWVYKTGGQHQLEIVEDRKPAAMRVSVWDFFPDMSAVKLADAEYIFERHYMTTRQLRDLKKLPGFSKEAVDQALESGAPKFQTSTHLNRMRAIAGLQSINDNRYEVWEYHGPIEKDDLDACGCDVSSLKEDEVEGVVWFCEGVVLKAVINPMETEDRPYSVCYCSKDDTSIFGFGFPYLLRAAQAVACASWRMVIDNAGLSVGPQVVVDRRQIVPLDGDYKLKSRKVWDFIGDGELKQAFMVFGIDAHVNELLTIFNTALRLGDDETNLPLIAQGNQAPHITKTAQGMSMLMNAANVVLRRAVKSYDDDITLTFLPRLYDWNMQFNKKAEIKGDFSVIARGSSVLMEKEQQTQALLQSMAIFNNPKLSDWINEEKYATALMKNLRIDDVMNDPKDVQAKREADAKNPPPVEDYRKTQEYAMADLQQRNQELVAKVDMHNQTISVQLQALANEAKMSEDELRAKLGIQKIKVDSQNAQFNVEAMLRMRTGEGI